MPSLGSNGRFGNQIFQYFYLTLLRKMHGVEIEIPRWLGTFVFDLWERIPSQQYSEFCEAQCHDSRKGSTPIEPLQLLTSVATMPDRWELWGYFQLHSKNYLPHREFFLQVFDFKSKFMEVRQRLDTICRQRKRVIGIHLRRGDYGYGIFYRAPVSWYIDWIYKSGESPETTVVYIASDSDSDYSSEFAPFQVISSSELVPVANANVHLIVDFYVLSLVDHLCISNSSFSFAASLLNQNAKFFARPCASQLSLKAFDPWNSEIIERAELPVDLHQLLNSVR